MSQDKSIQSLKPLVRYNKNFVYKGKKYQIDFDLIKRNSNYFYERQEEYLHIQDIALTDDLINFSEDCIPCFISSCHNESFEINSENVFSLYQLSLKYEVPSLTSLTDDFIKKHDKSLIFKSLQYKFELQNQTMNSINIEEDEDYISLNLFKYINNKELLNLPISSLYRIINNPSLNINQLNETNKNQLIDFLFKCLDEKGKKASVLFLNLDVENQRIEIFSKLINEYPKKFDFSMISHNFLMKTTTDLLSEMSQLKHFYSESFSQFKQLLKQIEDEKQKQKDIFDSFKKFAQEQLKNEQDKLNESFQCLKSQIESDKQKQQELNESFKQYTQKQLNEEHDKLNDSIQSLKRQIQNENENLRNENSRKIDEIRSSVNQNSRNIDDVRSSVNQNNDKMRTFITRDVFLYIF